MLFCPLTFQLDACGWTHSNEKNFAATDPSSASLRFDSEGRDAVLPLVDTRGVTLEALHF